jgi:hypothetical protein
MVFTAALVSLVVMLPMDDPQSATSSTVPPYSVAGVRRAAGGGTYPSIDSTSTEPRGSGLRLAVESQTVDTDPCARVITSCRPTWTLLAAPTWHDEFMTMTGPSLGSPLNSMAGNKDRLMAVASSAGFALAFQGVARLVQKIAVGARQNRVNKVRREIEAELAELEQLNQAARRGDPAVKKSPR